MLLRHVTQPPFIAVPLIHVGNFAAGVKVDLKGCISPGLHFKDINNDTFIDITDSRKAMDILLTLLPDTFQLIII